MKFYVVICRNGEFGGESVSNGFGFTPDSGGTGDSFNPFSAFNFGARGASSELITLEQLRASVRQFMAPHPVMPVGTDDQTSMNEAFQVAELWLDGATTFPRTSLPHDCAWSRTDWVNSSLAGWQKMVEPLAEGMATALATVLQEMTSQFGEQGLDEETAAEVREAIGNNLGLPQGFPPGAFNMEAIKPVMRAFMGSLIAAQLGQSVGGLALKVTGSHDVSMPLFTQPGTRLIPQNVQEWSAGLEIDPREITYFLALREAAAARLFENTPWLTQYVSQCMTEYGKGIRIDVDSMQEQAEQAIESGQLDIHNPQSINIAINQGMFMPEQTPAQSAALEKLEMAIALVEGWIDHVVAMAAKDRLPNFVALQEMQRRNRATNSPSQQLFRTLLGLEVSPRKARECANFWGELVAIGSTELGDDVEDSEKIMNGIKVRDHRWEDSALLPTVRDLANPSAFIASTTVPDDLSGLL